MTGMSVYSVAWGKWGGVIRHVVAWAWSVLACLDHLLRWLPSSGHLLLMKPLPWLKLSTSPITISTLRHLYNILLMIIKEGMNNLGGWWGSLSSSHLNKVQGCGGGAGTICCNLKNIFIFQPSLLRCCYPYKACISRAFMACDLVMLCGWQCVLIIGDTGLGLMLLCVCLLCPAFSVVALCALAPDLIAVHSDWLPCARLWLLVADLTSLCIIIQVTVSYFKLLCALMPFFAHRFLMVIEGCSFCISLVCDAK